MPAKNPSILFQAAFTIETLAHLRGLEREVLGQAEHLRAIAAEATRVRVVPAGEKVSLKYLFELLGKTEGDS